jgi:acyl-CoA dehydrogenase
MGKTNPDNPKHSQQSQILVPLDAKGVTILRRSTCSGMMMRRTGIWKSN